MSGFASATIAGMKPVMTLLVLLIYCVTSPAQMTSNVFTRVLHLKTGPNEAATGFTIKVDGREYLITAKHAVSALGSDSKIAIEQNGVWVDVRVKIYLCDEPVDVAVLVPPYQLTTDFDLPNENVTFQYGQDVFFLGFPYNLGGPVGLNGGYPMPFVKRGLISIVNQIDVGKKESVFLFDGYNNPGFSGGPLVAKDTTKSQLTYNVIGVVTAFRPAIVPVVSSKPIASPAAASEAAKRDSWRIGQKDDGSYVEYLDTENSAVLNTGIVQAFNIQPAIDLIRKHPEGPEEKALTSVPVLK